HCFSAAFGQREALSLTFSLFFRSIWAERGVLSYLFTVFLQHLGRERRPLLPFHCFSAAFGQREASSLTFLLFFRSIWAERSVLFYLFTVFPQHLGREMRPLLPFHCFSAAFGQREALSLTFSLFFRSIWAERSALSDHSAAFE